MENVKPKELQQKHKDYRMPRADEGEGCSTELRKEWADV